MESRVHRLPLPALLGQLGPSTIGDPVVLSTPAGIRGLPPRFYMAKALESMKDGIEHSVRPLHPPPRQLPHPLKDGVAIAIALGQDGQNNGGRRGGDQVFVDLHSSTIHHTSMH